jgi:hypothetical protein
MRRRDWLVLAAGAAACWAVRSWYFWATRRTRFPPPWYEDLAPWVLGGFAALIVTGLLAGGRWRTLRMAAVGACLMGIVFGAYAVATDPGH